VNITQGAEDDMMDAVASVGPVSVAIDVEDSFQVREPVRRREC